MIDVLIVDDSAAVRGLLRKIINDASGMDVVATASNGKLAVDAYRLHSPDVVIMDVEMPELDGLGALTQILQIDPKAQVIMCSSLTQRGADITLRALEKGAADYLPKPEAGAMFSSPDEFNRMMLEKISALGERDTVCVYKDSKNSNIVSMPSESQETFLLNPLPPQFNKADVVAVGSSTGGVQALFSFLAPIAGNLRVPVFITQHMPATFTKMLATHIQEKLSVNAYEAEDGMQVERGSVYIAPGNWHMEVHNAGGGKVIRLSDAPPENYCRPSVDPMFRSILNAYQKNIVSVVLTGMGADGLAGARQIVEKGNLLLAQDEASSVVWGMPGAVAKANICHAVLPLDDMGAWVKKYLP